MTSADFSCFAINATDKTAYVASRNKVHSFLIYLSDLHVRVTIGFDLYDSLTACPSYIENSPSIVSKDGFRCPCGTHQNGVPGDLVPS